MKLKIMTSEALSYVKKNIESLTDYYKKGEDPEKWLRQKLGKQVFKEVDALDFEEFNLILNEDKPSANDVMNIKLIYDNLKGINDSFASDERLFAGLTHTIFYEYCLKRFPNKLEPKDVLNHFFFNGSKPRCYMVNTIARLWWLGRKTYIKDAENPYEALDFIAHDLNGYSFTLFGSNWSNSERTKKLFFDTIFEYEKITGNKVDRDLFNDTMQHVNALCGIYALDACDDQFIKNKVNEYLTKRYIEIIKEKEFNKEQNIKTTGVDRFDNIIKSLNSLGGIASQKEIINAYQNGSGNTASPADVDYILDKIKENNPNSKAYSGKPIFHSIVVDGEIKIKIALEYLTKNNYEHMQEYLKDQINKLIGQEKTVFNIITALKKDKFTFSDVMSYKTQLEQLFPDCPNIEEFIKKGISSLLAKGLLEKQDDSFKKSYSIKL